MPYNITIRSEKTGEEHRVAGEFSDEDWAILSNFVAFADELEEAEYVKARLPLMGMIQWSDTKGWEIPELPPAGQVREFLHLLRPLILEGEDTYLPNVLGIIARTLNDKFVRANLKAARDAFLGKTMQGLYKWSVGDLVVNSDEGLKLWLNAFEYHRDEDKRALLKEMNRSLPLEVMKTQFIELLRYKYEVIAWTAGLIRQIERAPTNQARLSNQTADSASVDGAHYE